MHLKQVGAKILNSHKRLSKKSHGILLNQREERAANFAMYNVLKVIFPLYLYEYSVNIESLEQLSVDIQNLVNDIKQTEEDISGVSSSSLDEANRILRQVKQIEAGAQQALTTATDSLTVRGNTMTCIDAHSYRGSK